MKRSEIAKASKLMKLKTEAMDSSVCMSAEWLIIFGMAQGIEQTMSEFGYEWDGVEFVEVSI